MVTFRQAIEFSSERQRLVMKDGEWFVKTFHNSDFPSDSVAVQVVVRLAIAGSDREDKSIEAIFASYLSGYAIKFAEIANRAARRATAQQATG